MSLVNEIVRQLLAGRRPQVTVGAWSGSFNGHPQSVNVLFGRLNWHDLTVSAAFRFTVAAGLDGAGDHDLTATFVLPHGPPGIQLDGTAVPNGKVALLPKWAAGHPRIEFLIYTPTPADPLRHYRFDADVSLSVSPAAAPAREGS